MKSKIKFFKLLLSFLVLFALSLIAKNYIVKADTTTYRGENVYLESAEDLKELTNINNSGKFFLLMHDIDLEGTEWNSIDTSRMSGVFDGCGHTIKNFIIESSGTYAGIFSQNKLNIKNLFISEALVKNGENSGILAGLNLGDISNVHISGDLRANDTAGGLIAENYGKIDNCSFEGNVYGRTAGGLIANNYGNISNSFTQGNVSGQIIGGFAGSVTLPQHGVQEIKNCFSFSKIVQVQVTEGVKRAGGLIGVREKGVTVENCYAGNDFPCVALGDFNGAKELDAQERKFKDSYSDFDFDNYWDWDDSSNEITQRTIAVSSITYKVEDNNIFVTTDKAFYKNNETANLKLNVSETRPDIGMVNLQVCGADVTEHINKGEYSFNIENVENIFVEFKLSYLLRIEINLTNSDQLSVDKKYFAPGEDIVFVVKEIKGYKNPMLDAVFKDSQVKFTNITTEEDIERKVQKFKAEIDNETYAFNDILYVSVHYEKVNNLWWILLLSIGLPLLFIVIFVAIIVIKRRKKRIISNKEDYERQVRK